MNKSKFQRSLKRLVKGQLVAFANDSQLAHVIQRVGPNRYLVSWRGREVEVWRTQLCTFQGVAGKWVANRDAAPLLP